MREKIRAILIRHFNQDVPDHMLVLSLINLCAECFVYPEKLNSEETSLVKQAYVQLQDTGSL